MNTIDCGMCTRLKGYATGAEEYNPVYESEHTLAVYSTKGYAEVHVVIMTKRHLTNLFEIADDAVAADIVAAIQAASKEVIALKGACKLEMYLGEFQNTQHFHCHVIYDPPG